MGNSKRTPKITNQDINQNTPGPGMYNNGNTGKAKSYKFALDKRMKDPKTLTPGPGQYKIPYSISLVPSYQLSQGNFDLNMKYI